jgi:hypothetical protein
MKFREEQKNNCELDDSLGSLKRPHDAAMANRPMSLANAGSIHEHGHVGAGE